ncbi:hypothetical protein CVD25_13220 [Bacillus canaveralius]|uniref:YitT family protein n=1 Tax=Bacillus canaveralius TaxID=1403243 RepID=A0A2N5GGQ8_9BACI|nr:YitT family protein [Bacillus canaveralius]PLR79921.1 hypothetical protein CU635_20720 [Bacillus canaveralius]PLR96045.1 hypothetical protein CVD25_13220 [Bacillus canaveralius]RSK51649.1 hypothetical protein EJA13_14000 [Bacillus canaveralius]
MIHKLAAIFIGSLLIGIGINGFLVPHQLLDGGIVGIALILHYYFSFQTGISMFLLSIPLCVYAWFKERNYFMSSFQGLVVSSFFIDWLAPLQSHFPLPILISSILGGIIIGVGIGVLLRFEASTGGTDLLAHIISKAASINIGLIIFLIDGLVALMAFKTLGARSFIFSVITIFIVGAVTSLFVRNNHRNYLLWRYHI